MPNAIMQNDRARPTQESKVIALNEWFAANEEIVFMVPPVIWPQRALWGHLLEQKTLCPIARHR